MKKLSPIKRKPIDSDKLILAITFIVIMLIPSIVSVLYLGAFWDPYGQLSNVPVAFVNQDVPVTQDGKTYSIGNNLMDQLKTDDSAKWNFVDYNAAKKGVEDNKYYAMIIVPADMSQKIADAGNGKFEKPDIIYQANVSENYTYSRMSQKIADGIKQGIDEEIQKDTSKVLVDNLVDIQSNLSQASDGAKDLTDGIKKLQDGSASLSSGLKQSAEGASKLEKGLEQTPGGAKKLSDGANSLINGLEQLKSGLIQNNSDITTLTSGAGSLSSGTQALYAAMQTSGLSQKLAAAASGINNTSDGIDSAYAVLSSELQSPSLSDADKQAIGQVSYILGQIKASGLKANISGPLSTAAGSIDQLTAQLDTINSGAALVSSGVNQLAAGIADSQKSAASGVDQLISGEKDAKNGSDQLLSGLNTILSNQKDLDSGLNKLQSGALDLQTGIDSAYQGSDTLQAGLKTGAQTLTDNLKFNSTNMSDYLSSPVSVTDQSIDNVAYNGEGMAPYFISLSLWVGATFINIVLMLIFSKEKSLPNNMWRRYAYGLLLTMIQGLICSICLTALLGLQASDVTLYYLMTILFGAAFYTIVYGLSMFLPRAYVPVLICLMFVQVSGCGGSYPIESTPQFYQAVSNFLPMTYTVKIFRQIIGGINPPVLYKNFLALLPLIGLPFILGVLTQLNIKKKKEKSSATAASNMPDVQSE